MYFNSISIVEKKELLRQIPWIYLCSLVLCIVNALLVLKNISIINVSYMICEQLNLQLT